MENILSLGGEVLFTFYADTDFLNRFMLLEGKLPKRLCFLQGKSQIQKANFFSLFLSNISKSPEHSFLLLHPFLENQITGFCDLQSGNWIIDRDFFALPKEFPLKDKDVLSLSLDAPHLNEKHPLLRYLSKRILQKTMLSREYVLAASAMVQARQDLLFPFIQKGKLVREILRFSEKSVGISRELSGKPIHSCGAISALTPWGISTLPLQAFENLSRTFFIRDKLQVVAPLLIAGLSASFAAYGYEVFTFSALLGKEPIHMLVPELNIGFFTETPQEKFSFTMTDSVSAFRFVPLHTLLDCMPKLRFYALMQEELVSSAVYACLEAEEYRNTYEAILASKVDSSFLKEQQKCLLSFFSLH